MYEKFEQQMKKGFLDMLVLRLLKDEPKYGYKIIQDLKAYSDEVFQLKDGTLYPILYRLEEEELLVSEWSEAEGRQVPRKYYRITPKGVECLTQLGNSWNKIRDGIDNIMEGKK